MLKILLALVIIIATWLGGAPIAQILSWKYLGFALILFIGTGLLFRLFVFIRFNTFAWLTVAIMAWVAFQTGGIFKYVFSDMETYTLQANAPVSVERIDRNGVVTGLVRITNLGQDLMESAYVRCTLRWDNGQVVDHEFNGGIESTDRFLPGMAVVTRVVGTYDFNTYHAKPETMECKLIEATFVKPVAFASKLALQFGEDSSRNNVFIVTNNTGFAVTNVQFTCVAAQDGRTHQVTAYPAYNSNIRDGKTIAVGETAKFIDRSKAWSYTSCLISNAVEG